MVSINDINIFPESKNILAGMYNIKPKAIDVTDKYILLFFII